MPYDKTKTCFTCFWAWDKARVLRCTRNAPSPVTLDERHPDYAKGNRTDYPRCPGVPGCGEWKAIEDDEIDINDIQEDLRL